jgi:hypothetical protein
MDMDRNVYGDEPAWRDNWDTIVALVVSCASTLGWIKGHASFSDSNSLDKYQARERGEELKPRQLFDGTYCSHFTLQLHACSHWIDTE